MRKGVSGKSETPCYIYLCQHKLINLKHHRIKKNYFANFACNYLD